MDKGKNIFLVVVFKGKNILTFMPRGLFYALQTRVTVTIEYSLLSGTYDIYLLNPIFKKHESLDIGFFEYNL